MLGSGWTTAQLTVTVTFTSPTLSPPQAGVALRMEAPSETATEDRRAQALIIGANVVSFVEGFTPRERQDIIDSMVLARLAATAKDTSRTPSPDALAWLAEYFDALSNLGFLNVRNGTETWTRRAYELNVVDVMLDVLRPLIGEQREGAFLVFSRALRQLSRFRDLTAIVNDDSRRGQVACVQTTAVDRTHTGTVELTVVVVSFDAASADRNILLTRFRGATPQVDVHHRIFEVDMRMLEATRDAVAKRLEPLRPQTEQYVRAIPDPVETEASEQ